MTREKTKQAVIKVLSELQELRGKGMPEVDGNTCPLEELEGFDSVTAVEATTRLEDELDIELDAKLFWSKEDDTPLAVAEIADRVYRTTGGEKGASNERVGF